MPGENKIFIAIILAACIVGSFVYWGMINRSLSSQYNAANLNKESLKIPQLQVTASVSGATQKTVATCNANDTTIVTKVIDGDTVVVEGGYHVRLLGIDADEKNYPCYDAAKNKLEDLVLNKNIRLEKDITDTDMYGRCLRTIFLGNENIDAKLVNEGLAVARFYPPDVKYKSEISAAEKYAIGSKIGCKWNNVK